MDDNIKRKLAQKNGNESSYDKERIIKGVRKKYPHIDDEVAMLRKAVYLLILKVKEQHPDIDLKEFEEYYSFVENIKNN